MHTWILGGGLVRDDDGAKGIVLRRAALGAEVLLRALLALHLSITPNLPRLVFKVSWDIVLYFGLSVLILSMLGIDKFNERKSITALQGEEVAS